MSIFDAQTKQTAEVLCVFVLKLTFMRVEEVGNNIA
jgi:hypothetical protein